MTAKIINSMGEKINCKWCSKQRFMFGLCQEHSEKLIEIIGGLIILFVVLVMFWLIYLILK